MSTSHHFHQLMILLTVLPSIRAAMNFRLQLSVNVSTSVVVSKSGGGNFTTVTEAIDFAPNGLQASDGYFVIHITKGVYEEYVTIAVTKTYLMIVGDGVGQTIITGNRSAKDKVPSARTNAPRGTINSSTFMVYGQGFAARDITFRNTAGAAKEQAVAVFNAANQSVFYRCSFEAHQDTLFVHSNLQFYRECKIFGTVDFIFGDAAAVFQNSEIYARKPQLGQPDVITAQSREDSTVPSGIIIHNCSVFRTPELSSTVKTYLGRPWKSYSRTIIMQSFLDSLIDPMGWLPWQDTPVPNTIYYGEYDNRGVGSNTSSRINWPGYHIMQIHDAEKFTVSTFISGDEWLPRTGVPYLGGLLNSTSLSIAFIRDTRKF